MDLSCPSFLLDKLALNEQTSDYGSRETSDTESTIGGLCFLEFRNGKTFILVVFTFTHKLSARTFIFRDRSVLLVDEDGSESKIA